ncbi:hypothetical protein ACFFK0_08905 [Paenibacillus chartarius]|uniref:Uncharacterized protein n=1 Tax=Paenibacillus chartarius TaxID=747481 RepID=A0ABV6DIW3_9BACL
MKKQIGYAVLFSLAMAVPLDYAIFLISGSLYMSGLMQPGEFENLQGENAFVVVHYEMVWSHLMMESICIFVLYTTILLFRRRLAKEREL